MTALARPADASRPIVFRTRGRKHGPITRLMSPGDAGQLVKPFVFLDWFEAEPGAGAGFGWHPHSGIATLTLVMEGAVGYEETTGVKGEVGAGGIEWMRASGGVWHTSSLGGEGPTRGYQLWLAMPAALELGAPESRYLSADEVPAAGPARVVLGRYEDAASPVPAPGGITYLAVTLNAGETWRFEPAEGQSVAWIAVHKGSVAAPERVGAGEMAIFAEGSGAIVFEAAEDTAFILGAAVKHPHDLVTGHYSVHTSRAALAEGENGIRRIAMELQARGLIRLR